MAYGEGGGFRRPQTGPRVEHDAVCSECGQPCKVPFEPKAGKPVFCQECYRKRRSQQF
jgi:CxxC-x17-CxxC domain-containing protein